MTAFVFRGSSAGWVGIDLRRIPVSFVRSGILDPRDGKLWSSSLTGWWWASLSGDATYAYDLNINATNADPAGQNARYYGFPLRWFVPR